MTVKIKRLVMFFFPWVEVRILRWRLLQAEKNFLEKSATAEFRKAELYKAWADLRAANKGIRRLRKKLDKNSLET